MKPSLQQASPRPSFSTIVWRFLLGVAGGLAAGWFVFGAAVFRTGDRAFHCLSVGALLAGIITLLRASRPGQAVGLALGFGLVQLGLADAFGWTRAMAGVCLTAGALLVAWIFDLLARHGVMIGKFLIAGPLLGGVYLAIAPLAEFHSLAGSRAFDTLAMYCFVGIIVGDGVGLGAEIAELLGLVAGKARAGVPNRGEVRNDD
jgi:hypothetical protein